MEDETYSSVEKEKISSPDQAKLTNNRCCVVNDQPDWGSAVSSPPEDTIPPLITVPDDITEEAKSPDGAHTMKNNFLLIIVDDK
jgi:hypothetical protein